MGTDSNVLTDEDIKRLKEETDIKQKDIKKCHKKFSSLDKENKGFVSINDIVTIPEIENNPLRYHVAQYMSNNNENEAISFEAFIKVIDIFKNNKTDKQYKFMFDLFDFDKDGKISSEDMLINFKLLLGNSLNEEQIVEIVNKTISEYSNDQDQKFINYDEFVKILNEA